MLTGSTICLIKNWTVSKQKSPKFNEETQKAKTKLRHKKLKQSSKPGKTQWDTGTGSGETQVMVKGRQLRRATQDKLTKTSSLWFPSFQCFSAPFPHLSLYLLTPPPVLDPLVSVCIQSLFCLMCWSACSVFPSWCHPVFPTRVISSIFSGVSLCLPQSISVFCSLLFSLKTPFFPLSLWLVLVYLDFSAFVSFSFASPLSSLLCVVCIWVLTLIFKLSL